MRRHVHVGGRLIAAASVLAVAFGFAVAGYAEVLPPPLQHVAHQILGIAGVPNAPSSPRSTLTAEPTQSHHPGGGRSTPQPAPGGSTSPGHGHTSSASPGHKHHSPRHGSPSPQPSPPGSPSPTGSVKLTVSAAQTQLVAGDSVQLTGSLTKHDKPEAGAELTLLELAAGHTTWERVAHGRTGSQGELTLTVPALKRNASFLLTGPHGVRSAEVSIVVVLPVSVSVTQGSKQVDQLTVTSPLAQRGDAVELEVSSGGQWRVLHTHRLAKAEATEFSVVARKVSVSYRVVLLATPAHGQSVSNLVTLAPRTSKGKKLTSR